VKEMVMRKGLTADFMQLRSIEVAAFFKTVEEPEHKRNEAGMRYGKFMFPGSPIKKL
jgi:hypothetical protein